MFTPSPAASVTKSKNRQFFSSTIQVMPEASAAGRTYHNPSVASRPLAGRYMKWRLDYD